jgi:hypothetical protein
MFTELKKRFAPDPFKKFSAIMVELQELNRNLKIIGDQLDSLKAIVEFFDEVSKWHDRGLTDVLEEFTAANYKHRYDAIIGNLSALGKHFSNAGRDRYGWNRTEKGEVVIDSKVFLGNIYGLFTHSVGYWQRQKDAPKGGWGYSNMEHLNSHDVVSRQARGFMNSHIAPMAKLIDELETATAAQRAA